MSKQDLNAVRTAQDLERKYDLSSIAGLKKNYEIQKTGLTKVENELNDFVKVTTKDIEEIKNQVDGNITTWFSSGIPTLESYPANEWLTDNDKSNHLGDLYYNQDTGYAYRFALENGTYLWLKITDTDVTEALALANSAKDTADRKRQVFVVQPTPPYDVGDLWIKDAEIYRCQTSRPSGETFEDNDWIKATKYTDDTVANQVDGKLTILSGTVTEIKQDVDELNTTMTNTTKLVDEQGKTVGILQEKQSETTQTVNEISTKVSTVENSLATTNSNLSDLSGKVNANATDIGTIKTNVSELQQTDEQIKASVESIDKQIIPTASISGSNIYIEDGSNNPLIKLEIEGKSEQETTSVPNPDYPSEIESVGYENLYKIPATETKNGIKLTNNGNGTFNITGTATANTTLYMAIPLKESKIDSGIYTISCKSEGYTAQVDLYGTSWLATPLYRAHSEDKLNATATINITSDVTTVRCIIYIPSGKTINLINETIQLEKGSVAHPIIPYGKYGIEVETVGKSLLNTNALTTRTTDGIKITNNGDGSFTINGISSTTDLIFNVKLDKAIQLKKGKTYTLCNNANNSLGGAIILRSDENTTILSCQFNQEYVNYTPTSDVMINYLRFWGAMGITYTDFIIKPQLEEGSTATEFEKYKSNKSVIELDAPLRSLPNGVKDIAYIRNNKLYVDRKVGSLIFNGSENWIVETAYDGYARFKINDFFNETIIKNTGMNNHFKQRISEAHGDYEYLYIQPYSKSIYIQILPSRLNENSVNGFKTWLSTNNVKVDYELVTPVTEELGEIQMPSTFKGVNHISTTDELEPTINIEYVRDTTLSNYVEGQINKVMTIEKRHYSELVIEDDNIKTSVTEINDNISGMTKDINTVQDTLTSTSKTIEVISTNIDKTTGEIREVTTINGYKFNKDGLNIYTNENSFNTLIDNEGTYYKDGDTIISETTKDGFMATSIKNKGSEEYCYDETNKVYDFVKERIEVDGEYGYATFYNGVN